MYYPNNIEEICYDQDHIEKVWNEMQQVIPTYFQKYIDTEGGHSIKESEIEKLAIKLGSISRPKSKLKNSKAILSKLLKESIKDYEKECENYRRILNLEALEEYKQQGKSISNSLQKYKKVLTKTAESGNAIVILQSL